jgi:glycerol-3-phosphate acyltransferase PlsY
MPSPPVMLVTFAAAYLIGAIPFGLIIGRVRGVDIRHVGSGNIGATNVARVLGRPLGVCCFVLDLLKGLLPTALAPKIWVTIGPSLAHGTPGPGPSLYLAWMGVAAAAILGHMCPIYLRFRGGKGVATSLGAVVGFWPYFTGPGLAAFALWVLVAAAFRYVSLASIVATLAFPVLYAATALLRGWDPFGTQAPLLIFAVVIALLVVYRHRSNIQRLLAGQEHRIGGRSSRGSGQTEP